MARFFRYYGKKRGDRRTGSRTLGSAGEALFFAVFLLLGCGVGTAMFLGSVLPQWRVNYEYVLHTCKVIDRRISEKQGDSGTLYRVDIEIEYEIDGQGYHEVTYDVQRAYSSGKEDKQAILDRFTVYSDEAPGPYPCWYDPEDPRKVVLVRGFSWWIWLVFIIPASFVVIGAGGLIYTWFHWGKSAERRAAIARRARQRDPFKTNGQAQRDFPGVPAGGEITNSPGTKLQFRLPISTSPGWAVFGAAMVCLLWNGIVSVFVVVVVRGHLDGEPNWFLTLFMIPFVLVGIGLIVYFIRQFLVATGVGPTTLEISDHPLHPGEQCRLLVCQSGRLDVNSLTVLLVCEEEATYRQGTNTRTETREVHRQTVLRHEDFEVRRGLPFEAECALSVPPGAMHSFKSDHNEIGWTLLVQGDVAGWPDYQRAFPIIIRPNDGKGDA
ncbi:MAG TPA: hypothetical protein VMY42_26205 [Thermoguttaceae bacterium]|nr:hypothetical protein [Thermoguttaceae bacterium]